MFLIFDYVRDNINRKMDKEIYLSGYSFLFLQKKLNYENISTPDNPFPEYFQSVKSETVRCLNHLDDWQSRDEILAWKAFALRDLICFFYREWKEFIALDLLKPAHFSDGKECVLIESVCSRRNLDPTSVYNILKEIKFMLLYMKATVNSIVIEADGFHKMNNRLSRKNDGGEFIAKRIRQELDRLKLSKYRQLISEAQSNIWELIPDLCESELELFTNAEYLLSRLNYCLNVFLNPQLMKDHLNTLQSWMNTLLTFDDSPKPPPALASKFNALHLDVTGKLALVTKLLYAETVNNQGLFDKRNNIVNSFIPEAFDEEIEKQLLEKKFSL